MKDIVCIILQVTIIYTYYLNILAKSMLEKK